jgi:hypothetical protein
MEPKLPTPNLGPEQTAAYYGQSSERMPGIATPETSIEREGDRFERRNEITPRVASTPPPASIALPLVPPPVVEPAVAPLATNTPLAANDDDLIEMEWVKKAKQIITETKDDPYRREQEVGRLQADYLRKRYGKELGAPQ